MTNLKTDLPTAAAPTNSLSPLPGEICEQYIRCGKPGCRCEDGHRHGPYYYRIWREGERVHKVYVRRSELEAVQKACRAYRDCQQQCREARRNREILMRNIQQEWRRARRLLRQTLPLS